MIFILIFINSRILFNLHLHIIKFIIYHHKKIKKVKSIFFSNLLS